MFWYTLLVLLHVLASFAFVAAHGVGAVVALRLPRERALDRIRAMLEVVEAARPAVQLSLWLVYITGAVLGFLGGWWRTAWIWISLVLLVAVTAWMSYAADRAYTPLKRAVGLAYREGLRIQPPRDPLRPEEIAEIVSDMRLGPVLLAGYGAIVLIIALMVLKPF